jgi:putative restriction endonuclease
MDARNQAWLFVSRPDDRTYHGNDGYVEDAESFYAYDSNVPNHARVKEGDVVVLAGRHDVMGTAIIEHIEESPGEKTTRYCPICGNMNLKKRRTKAPPYRCDNGHEFDRPEERTNAVTQFRAWYASTFRRANHRISRESLRPCERNPRSQSGIRPLDHDAADRVFRSFGECLPSLRR